MVLKKTPHLRAYHEFLYLKLLIKSTLKANLKIDHISQYLRCICEICLFDIGHRQVTFLAIENFLVTYMVTKALVITYKKPK